MLFIGDFVMSKDRDIRQFVETFKITFPVGRDDGIAETFGVRGVPVTIFIGKNGRTAKKHAGGITAADLQLNIDKLLD